MRDVIFDLSFTNWEGILFALIPALLNLCIIFYILFYMPYGAVSRSFGLFTFCLFLWQADDVFARMVGTYDGMAFWDSVLCVGWIFAAPVGLYFALLYTGKKSLATSIMGYLLLFGPALIFEGIFKSGLIDHRYIYTGFWGWVDDHDASWIDRMLILWIGVQVVFITILLWRHAVKSRDTHLSTQSVLIALGITIPAAQGVLTQLIFPQYLDLRSVPVTSTFMSCFSVATAIALSKYKLFSVTESVSTEILLENMTDIVFTISPEGTISYVNPYGMELLCINEPDTKRLRLEDIFAKHSELGRFQQEALQPAMDGQYTQNFSTGLVTAEGKKISVLISSDPIFNNRRLQGVLCVARDVTDVRLAEDKLREKNLELKRSNAELETFAFVASHDLKEPLRMVSNYTQLLQKKLGNQLDRESSEFIGYAVRGVYRMQALINDLLEYSRIGKAPRQTEPVYIDSLMNEVLKNLENKINDTGAVIMTGELPMVIGVKSQLMQLFQNLVENAIKFNKNPTPKITVRAKDNEDNWLFSVEDNGIGIDPAYKDKIFMIFQRLHDREEYSGTGIGLTVCKKIVELHGGRIWFESEPAEGTTFFFTLKK